MNKLDDTFSLAQRHEGLSVFHVHLAFSELKSLGKIQLVEMLRLKEIYSSKTRGSNILQEPDTSTVSIPVIQQPAKKAACP